MCRNRFRPARSVSQRTRTLFSGDAATTTIIPVYLTVDQTQLRDSDGLKELLRVGETAAATGTHLEIWEAAHSLRTGWVSLTAWWENLAALEAASQTLRDAKLGRNRSQGDGTEPLSEPIVQRLLTVVNGPTEFDPTHKYLRILEISCQKDMQAAIDDGLELAEKVSSISGISLTLLRNVTGFSRDMMFLSTYESLTQYEDAGHHLQATSYWFHNRSQYGKAFDASTLAMNLFRRLGSD
jgi:hypothetical protein